MKRHTKFEQEMQLRFMKVGPNKSSILTDDEWSFYIRYMQNIESLEHYEQTILQKRKMNTNYNIPMTESLVDRIWHERNIDY